MSPLSPLPCILSMWMIFAASVICGHLSKSGAEKVLIFFSTCTDFRYQSLAIFLAIVLNPPKAKLATAAAKPDISPENVLNKKAELLNPAPLPAASAAALIATNVSFSCSSSHLMSRWQDWSHCPQLSHE